jgi:hypothetical protein
LLVKNVHFLQDITFSLDYLSLFYLKIKLIL